MPVRSSIICKGYEDNEWPLIKTKTNLGQERCAIKVVRGIEVTPKIRDVSLTYILTSSPFIKWLSLQRFLREVEIWRKVWEKDKGEHMLPFWGACLSDGPYPYVFFYW